MAVKNIDYLNVRVPRHLTLAIERERKRVKRETGIKVRTSDVVRCALEEKFLGRKTRAA